MTQSQILQPDGWPRPKGYANGIAVSGRMIFTAGVIGWTKDEVFERDDLPGQFEQVLVNTIAILAEAGAGPEHIVRMTCYVTDKSAYVSSLKAIGEAWRRQLGRVFPCMAVIIVSGLVESKAQVEIETTAVIPDQCHNHT